ncbi:FG-GAP repeat protein [Teredinibacter haidensis]|uniref:FG-GAP repeat protein n=1 Tax=Teredinibacter haidensis TaxID=2731755 RepID=UPI000948E9E6|nr:FG-GAP repeat protein [Teredinibacter haidensis]
MKNKNISRTFAIVLVSGFFASMVGCGGGLGEDEDTNPDAFYFDDEDDIGLGEYVISEPVTIEGIDTETIIWIEGGEYSIDGAAFTDEEGEITNEQEVYVRVLSSELLSTETEAVLYVGDEEDTFTVKTVDIALSARDGFKNIVFSWPSVTGAVNYKILEKINENAEFVQKGRLFSSEAIGYEMDVAVHKHDWLGAEYKLEACTNAYCSTTDEISLYNFMGRSIGYFKASNSEENDLFGVLAISADGNTIAVGAPGEDSGSLGVNRDDGDNSISGSGAVFVYVNDDGAWRLQSYIKAPAPDDGDAFGSSVSLSSDGSTLVVGVPFDDSADFKIDGDALDNTAQDSGAVYVFRRFGETWFQQNFIKPSAGAAGDQFGLEVELSDFGGTLVVSAPGRNITAADSTAAQAGGVFVYELTGDNWVELAELNAPVPGDDATFGSDISLSANGNRLLVGAEYYKDGLSPSATTGRAYVFDRSDNTWVLAQELSASNARDGMRFGAAVALAADGATAVVGAPGESSNAFSVNGDEADTSFADAGAGYVFEINGSDWQQVAYLKAQNSDSSDRFGSAVAINAEGSLIVVGAPGESSVAEAIHGNEYDNSATDAGAAYTFTLSENNWEQLSYVKAPNTDAGDFFASTLDLDASGDALLIGAPFEQSDAIGISGSRSNNLANKAGAVYLY